MKIFETNSERIIDWMRSFQLISNILYKVQAHSLHPDSVNASIVSTFQMEYRPAFGSSTSTNESFQHAYAVLRDIDEGSGSPIPAEISDMLL